jgi:hypothetical protein
MLQIRSFKRRRRTGAETWPQFRPDLLLYRRPFRNSRHSRSGCFIQEFKTMQRKHSLLLTMKL